MAFCSNSIFQLSHLLSDISGISSLGAVPVYPSPCFALAKYEEWGPQYIPIINNEDGRWVPVLGWWREFFHYGDNKRSSVFSLVNYDLWKKRKRKKNNYDLCTCRANVSVRKTAMTVKDLNPKSAPTNETLCFLYL